MDDHRKPLPLAEFVTLLAMMISILALSIDAMLPALEAIGADLEVKNPNDVQLVVSSMFLGFAVGQILAGPISDSFGRKPVIYVGYALFMLGCLLSMFAEAFWVMLAGRVLQGVGAAAPRIVSIALVRDGYEGRMMARIMSIVMAIFILVPAIAPAMGQAVLWVTDWRAIFGILLLMACIAFVWFGIRQPETLLIKHRRPFSTGKIVSGLSEAWGYRAMSGYTMASGIIFGAFVGYLSSAQQIFQSTFQTGEKFVLYFGAAALAIGVASVFNSRTVVRLGMRYLTWRALFGQTLFSMVFFVFVLLSNGSIGLVPFMVWLIATFFCVGIMFGNFNALAMEPVGHLAGIGAALTGSVSTFISLPIGWAIGAAYDGSVFYLVLGFAICGLLSLAVMWWTERGSS